jgi:hypothetical protein
MRATKTQDDVQRAFADGTILQASRSDLEQLLLANAKNKILDTSNQARAAEMGETMRQLLAVRQSEEMHGKATIISVIALIVSLSAFICSGIQAYYSYATYHRADASLRSAPPSMPATPSRSTQ